MNKIAEDILMHYGTKRHSGRYPWGSGEQPYQHSGDFLSRVEELHKEGLSETEIAKTLSGGKTPAEGGMSTTELRAYKAIARSQRRQDDVRTIKSLKADGLNNSEIARKLGKPESTIRSLLAEDALARSSEAMNVAEKIKTAVDEKGLIDVGAGVEKELGVSRETLNQALIILEAEGYSKQGASVAQITNPNQRTILEVIGPPGTTNADAYKLENIHTIIDYAKVKPDVQPDVDITNKRYFAYPESISSKRVAVRYAEDGGIEKDGVIELRRGVEDISLGSSNYAQVRILVDGSHYLKGMALYSDDLPDGVDILFNTNKHSGTPMMGAKDNTVLKPIKKDDPDNPFGAYIKEGGQRYYTDKDGKEHLSVINKVREEGDWNKWSSVLSSQFLSKQPLDLAKKQLNLSYSQKLQEYDEIVNLTNPAVKKNLLLSFANDCDAAAVDLDAAALPRQSTKVILPVPELKDNQIYAPGYNNGERVCLVRFPHEGTFNIPELVVNNKNPKVKERLGNLKDAVGINSTVAGRLSGADFDGDFVLVLPVNDKVRVKTSEQLKELKGFEPKEAYGTDHLTAKEKANIHFMGKSEMQIEMGKISNLITDMTLRGAQPDEMVRAVKHSMVVVDAEKHKLDFQRSYNDNNIAELRQKYQGAFNNNHLGASTLISKAGAPYNVAKPVGTPKIDPDTGALIIKRKDTPELTVKYRSKDTGNKWMYYSEFEKKGGDINSAEKKEIWDIPKQKSTRMREVSDAKELSSGHPMETIYANYANSMKALANTARKEYLATGRLKYDPTAAKVYYEEVKSLDAKLLIALKNAPRERQANILATSISRAKRQDNPDMSKEAYKKIGNQALVEARKVMGASGKDTRITITEREWEAIQAGAISNSKLNKILTKADSDVVRKLATPSKKTGLTNAQLSMIKSMDASGYTIAEIAKRLGVSSSTVSKNLN